MKLTWEAFPDKFKAVGIWGTWGYAALDVFWGRVILLWGKRA